MSLLGILDGFETCQKQFFHIFGAREKIRKIFFQEKISFYRKNRRFFSDFFYFRFSIPKSFSAPPKSDFSPKNRTKLAIFLSMTAAYRTYPKTYIYSLHFSKYDNQHTLSKSLRLITFSQYKTMYIHMLNCTNSKVFPYISYLIQH